MARSRRAAVPTSIVVSVGDVALTLLVDAAHLEAHRRDFVVPIRRVLAYVARALVTRGPGVRRLAGRDGPGSAMRWLEVPEVVGWAGVIRAGPRAFWGYRLGRATPSHLVHGRKRRTRRLTLYGTWDAPRQFRLRTVYAGNPTPREIHDPSIPPRELDAAIAFWGAHAIVVRRGDYTRAP